MERLTRNVTNKGVPYTRKVLVLGGTGHGKSSLINTIRDVCECEVGDTWATDKSITKEIEEFNFNQNDNTITFFDTPELKTLKDNKKFTDLYETGFDAVVVVYSIKAFTQSHPSLLKQVEKTLTLKEKMGSHLLVVLTFADYLEDATIKEFLCTHKELSVFLQRYGVEFVVICNKKDKNSQQEIQQRNVILSRLDRMFRSNERPLSKKRRVIGAKCMAGIILTSLVIIGIGVLVYVFHL